MKQSVAMALKTVSIKCLIGCNLFLIAALVLSNLPRAPQVFAQSDDAATVKSSDTGELTSPTTPGIRQDALPTPSVQTEPARQAPLEMLEIKSEQSGSILSVPTRYPSIQKAVDAAKPGDMVLIGPGDYVGDVRLKDGITLAAESPNTVSLDGAIHFANDVRLINLTFVSSRVGHPVWDADALEDWELPGTTEKQESADVLTPPALSNIQILMCRFTGKQTTSDTALLHLQRVSGVAIHACVFSQSKVTSHGQLFGVFLLNCDDVRFQGNTIADLHETHWGIVVGCYLEQCSGIVSNNLIVDILEEDWDSAFGMLIVRPRGLDVVNNTIANVANSDWDSTFGISVRGAGACNVERNLIDNIRGPGWTAPVFGIHSDTTEPVILDNNVCRLTPERRNDEMRRPYIGTGGSINYQVDVEYMDASFRLTGPQQLLSKSGNNKVGLYAGQRIAITVPQAYTSRASNDGEPSAAQILARRRRPLRYWMAHPKARCRRNWAAL
jgi:hypothetical protein